MAIDEKREVDIEALFRSDAVGAAIRRGALEAMRQHIRAGESMVSWEDGKVVHIPPEELKKILAKAESES